MHELLFYVYSGRSPNVQNMALELLAAADRFQLPGLKDMCDQVWDSYVCSWRIKKRNHSCLGGILIPFSISSSVQNFPKTA